MAAGGRWRGRSAIGRWLLFWKRCATMLTCVGWIDVRASGGHGADNKGRWTGRRRRFQPLKRENLTIVCENRLRDDKIWHSIRDSPFGPPPRQRGRWGTSQSGPSRANPDLPESTPPPSPPHRSCHSQTEIDAGRATGSRFLECEIRAYDDTMVAHRTTGWFWSISFCLLAD
jgi:hypothetical protein